MAKKHKKLCTEVAFVVFLFVTFLTFLPSTVSAVGLELQYPTISGQTITTNTKLPDYVLYLFNVGMFLGFFSVSISLIIAGVIYFLSPAKADLLADAKDRISGAISGLLILVLTYLIVTTINPQLSIFKSTKLPATEPSMVCNNSRQCVAGETGTPCTTNFDCNPPGVYFYRQPGCSDNLAKTQTANVLDLNDLKNKVTSVGIQQDPDNKTYYVSILYNNVGLWGRCQYLNPNKKCHSVTPFAASASVHVYDFNPQGDIYFYRKSYFDDAGGYFKVRASDVRKMGGIYIEALKDLKFQNVPEEEQDCIKYKKNGECATRAIPSLGGENISSVRIDGDYIVLFVYFGPTDSPTGIWTSCQEFPTVDDVNRFGPQQLKWENIRNTSGLDAKEKSTGGIIPNYVIIIPIQK